MVLIVVRTNHRLTEKIKNAHERGFYSPRALIPACDELGMFFCVRHDRASWNRGWLPVLGK